MTTTARAATHRAAIRSALLAGARLSSLDAIDRWRCTRLAARICELRQEEGLEIVGETGKDGVYRYRLDGPRDLFGRAFRHERPA